MMAMMELPALLVLLVLLALLAPLPQLSRWYRRFWSKTLQVWSLKVQRFMPSRLPMSPNLQKCH
jgi:hypothetical protein